LRAYVNTICGNKKNNVKILVIKYTYKHEMTMNLTQMHIMQAYK